MREPGYYWAKFEGQTSPDGWDIVRLVEDETMREGFEVLCCGSEMAVHVDEWGPKLEPPQDPAEQKPRCSATNPWEAGHQRCTKSEGHTGHHEAVGENGCFWGWL